MTKIEAQAILNKVREGNGSSISLAQINAALHLTGDLGMAEAVRGEGLDTPIPREDKTTWSQWGETVVVEDLRGFRAYSWLRRFGRS
jgi:hypothetical protein